MLDVDLGMPVLPRALLRRDEGLLGLLGQLVRIYHFASLRSLPNLSASPRDTLKAG
jgi:hypothetical protein